MGPNPAATVVAIANGGKGAITLTGASTYGLGGLGGIGTNNGGNGGTAVSGSGSGGGGGGAGDLAAGGTGSAIGAGSGGSGSIAAGGNGGTGINTSGNSGSDGNTGTIPGGGGSGGRTNSQAHAGGAGARGELAIQWTCPQINVGIFAITSPVLAICAGKTATVTVSSSALADGAYTVNYTLSVANTGSFSVPLTMAGGVGTFTTTAIAAAGATTLTINQINCTPVETGITAAITVNALPVPTFTASAPVSSCVNGDITYKTQKSQSTYVWTMTGVAEADYHLVSGGTAADSTMVLHWLTTGSKTVTVNYQETVNNCQGATPASSTTTVYDIPVAAGLISGAATVCQGANAISYSVPAITNATSYIWAYSGLGATITGTTANVTISFAANATPGNLTVQGSSFCGTGTVSADYPIAVSLLPDGAGIIAGSSGFCAGTTGVAYSVPLINGATSYTWSYTGTGATITGTTNSVTVDFALGATSGNITVSGTNACGNGVSASYPVTLYSVPVAAFTASATSIAAGSSVNFFDQSTGGALTNWAWSFPGGVPSSSTAQNPSAINYLNPGTYAVTLNATNSCGNNTLTVNGYITVNHISSSNPNNYTFTVPVGVTSITVEAWGGGGAGGSGSAGNNAVGGGGGGAYATNVISVTPGQKFFYTVGAGGVPNSSSGTNPTTAGVSYFGNTSPGVPAGSQVYAVNGAFGSNSGGAGGLASNCNPSLGAHSGGSGASPGGGGGNNSGGGGGGSAGGGGNGGNGATITAGTAGIAGSLTAGAAGGTGGANGAIGNPGVVPGGGGGGKGTSGTLSGAGANGQVNISWPICATVDVSNFNIVAANTCSGSPAVVTVNSSTLPDGTYTVTYDLSGTNTGTYLTSSMVFASHTGTFTTQTLTNTGATTVTAIGVNCTVLLSGKTSALTVNALPTITSAGTALTQCYSATVQSTTMGYTATTNSPTSYSIVWNGAAHTAGLLDQGSTAFSFAAGGGTLAGIVITAGALPGNYSGTMTITTDNGCIATQPITLTINALPTITGEPASPAAVCSGSGAPSFTVTATGTALTYQWEENTGSAWAPVTNGGVYAGATTTTLTISAPTFSMNGYKYHCVVSGTCSPAVTTDGSATLTVYDLPTISTTGTAATVCYSAGVQSTTLVYTATTVSPTSYSIVWNGAAHTAGLADQSATSFSFAAGSGSVTGIVITAGTLAGGPYSGTMTIVNGNGCSSTQAITVTVNPVIAGNTSGSAVSICDNSVTTLFGGTPTGGAGSYTYLWESSDGATGTFITATGISNTADYTTETLTTSSTQVWFRRTVISGACSDVASAVKVTVNPVLAGNSSGSNVVICNSSTTTLTGGTPTGGSGAYTYLWESSDALLGTYSAATGINTGADYTTETLTTSSTQIYFHRKVTSGGCTDIAAAVKVTVNPAITGNSSGSAVSICNGSSTTLSGGTAVGGSGVFTYLWESSDALLGTYSAAAGANTGADYTTETLTTTAAQIYFHRKVTSGGCTDIAAAVKVTVNPAITGNSSGSDVTICNGSTTTLIGGIAAGGSGLYTYLWESSDALAGVYGPAFGTNTGVDYTTAALSTTTTQVYFRRTVYSGGCTDVSTAVKVTVDPAIVGNTSGLPVTICTGSSTILTGGTPTNGSGSYTYLWESSATETGVYASAAGTNTGANYTTDVLTTSSTDVWFRRTVISGPCTDVAAAVKVTVNPLPDAPAAITGGSTVFVGLTTQLSDLTAGGTWSSGTLANATVDPSTGLVTGVATGTSLITYTVTSGGCSNSVSQLITVSIASRLNVKVFLEGFYNTGISAMNTNLVTSSLVPLTQPYTGLPWSYAGGESVLAIPANVTDWVLVELRQATTAALATSATKLSGWPKACFLKSDGSIVALDGTSLPVIGNPSITPGNNLYVVIRHRNHVAIMSSTGLTLNLNNYEYDFSTAISKAYGGTAGYKLITTGLYGMVAGDADSDGSISVNDFTKWAIDFGKVNLYLNSDIDGDGQISVNDFTRWAINFGIDNIPPVKSLSIQGIDPKVSGKFKSQVPGN